MAKLEFSEDELREALQNNPDLILDSDSSSPDMAQSNQSQILPQTNGFYVSQTEYIDYLITKRVRQNKRAKGKILLQHLANILVFIMKFIMGSLVFCLIVYGFYFVVWLGQNSINQYWLNQLTTP